MSIRLICLAAGLLLLSGCGSGSPSPAPQAPPASSTCPPPLDAPLAAPTFTTHVLPALQSGCGSTTTACHGGLGIPNGHVSYFTGQGRTAAMVHQELVGATPSDAPVGWERVKAGDPDHSWILEKLTKDCPGGTGGNCYGHRMPLGNPPLCPTAVDNLRTWIRSGAPL